MLKQKFAFPHLDLSNNHMIDVFSSVTPDQILNYPKYCNYYSIFLIDQNIIYSSHFFQSAWCGHVTSPREVGFGEGEVTICYLVIALNNSHIHPCTSHGIHIFNCLSYSKDHYIFFYFYFIGTTWPSCVDNTL